MLSVYNPCDFRTMKQKTTATRKAQRSGKKDMSVIVHNEDAVDEAALFERIAVIIENRKIRIQP